MSYHIYTTDGIILKRTPFGEANILLHILTEDLGLIIASAQSARVSHSKLRPALQEYTYLSVSCVKGKNGWKVTNVIPKENFFFDYPQYVQKIVSQISTILVRMMPGEESHREVFSVVQSGFSYLKNHVNLTGSYEYGISNFECLIMLRILYFLGYISNEKQTEKFLMPILEWNESLLNEVSPVKSVLIEKINKGLKESQL
jgi:DNA repair protein RecO